jgi:hypothetical protein
MPEIEPLDVRNIVDIEKIRELLVNDPDLMIMFEIICSLSNDRINSTD